MVGAADPPAQLVQLRESEPVRAVDQDRVRGRYVDTRLDDRRADEDLEAPVIEVEHQELEVPFAHLAVADSHRRLGYEPAQALRENFDVLDRVVHEVDLAAAADLAQAGFP